MDGRLGRSIANCKIEGVVPFVGMGRRLVQDLLDIIDIENLFQVEGSVGYSMES